MVQPGAAPAEVEVLATGVGPGWAWATPAYGRRCMKELSRRPERGWSQAWQDKNIRSRLTGQKWLFDSIGGNWRDNTWNHFPDAADWKGQFWLERVPTKPDGTFLTGQIWLNHEFLWYELLNFMSRLPTLGEDSGPRIFSIATLLLPRSIKG
jgi:hypothetical protein